MSDTAKNSEEYRKEFHAKLSELPIDSIDMIGEVYRSFIPTMIGQCPICNSFIMSNQHYEITATRERMNIVHSECKQIQRSVRQSQILENIMSQRDEAITALKRISSYMGQQYVHSDGSDQYDAGFEAGRDSMSEIAQDSLATIEALQKEVSK